MRKRVNIALTALDAVAALAWAICLIVATTRPAWAYVDPSVMTYTIQALAGVAVAMSAVIGVVWRRARRWLLKAMRVDENAGKAVERDVRALDPASGGYEKELAEADAQAEELRLRQVTRERRKLRWSERLLLALVAAVALSFTVLFAAPLEVVAGNASDLVFDAGTVWKPLALFSAIAALVLALVLSLFKKGPFDVAVSVVCALVVCAFVQPLLLNSGLPSADGLAVDWSMYTKVTLFSALVWAALIAAFVVLALKQPVVMRAVSVLACVVVVLSESIALGGAINAADQTARHLTITREGLMSVSTKSNVVVFVLDTYDTAFLDQTLQEYPDALDEFGGFTWFHNSTGSTIPTRYAMPSLVTGHSVGEQENIVSRSELYSWFSDENVLDLANEAGYSVGVYSDTDSMKYGLASEPNDLSDKTMNVHDGTDFEPDAVGTVTSLVSCALYRDLPWIAKPLFRFYTDDLNQAVAPKDDEGADLLPYLIDDASYYEDLKARGLAATDDAESGAFRLIHLMGAHAPYTLDANAQSVGEENSSLTAQCAGSLEIVSEYLRQLKELGVYDQTCVIVTADHGEWWKATDVDRPTNPFLLVKPAGADASAPCTRSEAPTGHLDLKATELEAMGLESDDPTVFEVEEGPRKRYFYWTEYNGETDLAIREWEIDGDAQDFDDWHNTGREWHFSQE